MTTNIYNFKLQDILLANVYNFKLAKYLTALIRANRNSNIRGVIPRSALGLTSKSPISPSIV